MRRARRQLSAARRRLRAVDVTLPPVSAPSASPPRHSDNENGAPEGDSTGQQELVGALAKEERRLREAEDDEQRKGLMDLPARSGAVFTVIGAVAGLLASSAVFGASDWNNLAKSPWYARVIGLFVVEIVLISVAVWLALGALPPPISKLFQAGSSTDASESEASEVQARVGEFVEAALNDIASDELVETWGASTVDIYMAGIAHNSARRNSQLFAKRRLDFVIAVWILRVLFLIGIVLFAFGVIMRTEGKPEEKTMANQKIVKAASGGKGGAKKKATVTGKYAKTIKISSGHFVDSDKVGQPARKGK